MKSNVHNRVVRIINILSTTTENMLLPAASLIIKQYGKDPFMILISCILSLRTRDTTSFPASVLLFAQAKTPQQMVDLPVHTIQDIIKSVGFYKRKALYINRISYEILTRFNGVVPCTQAELLSLPGVGRKTMNLVLSEAFDCPAICVDTHVHRIANRLGWVRTKTPEQTEQELKEIVPIQYWSRLNRLFVMWGQNICLPLSPKCSICPLLPLCPRVGVLKSR